MFPPSLTKSVYCLTNILFTGDFVADQIYNPFRFFHHVDSLATGTLLIVVF